jgi:hypothetical protein
MGVRRGHGDMMVLPASVGLVKPATGGVIGPFWSAIAAINPELWLRMTDASGSTATNFGSLGNGTYTGAGMQYSQGSLCSTQPGANSVQTDATGEYIQGPTGGAGSNYVGVIGICYAGTGAGDTATRILWRSVFGNAGFSYIRIDMANIIIQPSTSIGAVTTSVLSSTIKDGNPHLILLTRESGDTANLRLYIDGVNVWTYALGAGALQVSTDLVIGRNGNTAQYTYGRYGDVFMRNGAVSNAQILAINSAWAP